MALEKLTVEQLAADEDEAYRSFVAAHPGHNDMPPELLQAFRVGFMQGFTAGQQWSIRRIELMQASKDGEL